MPASKDVYRKHWPIGARVVLSSRFLRGIGDHSWDSANRVGTVIGGAPYRDNDPYIVEVEWDSELYGGDKVGRVMNRNLWDAERKWLEPV